MRLLRPIHLLPTQTYLAAERQFILTHGRTPTKAERKELPM